MSGHEEQHPAVRVVKAARVHVRERLDRCECGTECFMIVGCDQARRADQRWHRDFLGARGTPASAKRRPTSCSPGGRQQLRPAGADIVLTYWAAEVAAHLD